MKPKLTIKTLIQEAKIFGLGYNLLVFVYDKKDDHDRKSAVLDFVSCSFVEKGRTGDYTMTLRLREMISDGANEEDIAAYLNDLYFPGLCEDLEEMVREILAEMPQLGCFKKQPVTYMIEPALV